MHARIENYCKNKSVYTQQEWCRLITECKIIKPYAVHEVEQSEILNFAVFAENFFWRNVKISSLREISVAPQQSFISVKYDFEKDLSCVKMFKKNVTTKTISAYPLQRAYSKKIILNTKNKLILKLCYRKI